MLLFLWLIPFSDITLFTKVYQSFYCWLPKIVSNLKNSPWKSFIHAQDPLVIPGVVQQRDFRDYVSHALRDLRDDGLPFRTCPRLPALWQIVFSNSCQPTAQICQGRKLFAPIQWQLFIHSLVPFLTDGSNSTNMSWSRLFFYSNSISWQLHIQNNLLRLYCRTILPSLRKNVSRPRLI